MYFEGSGRNGLQGHWPAWGCRLAQTGTCWSTGSLPSTPSLVGEWVCPEGVPFSALLKAPQGVEVASPAEQQLPCCCSDKLQDNLRARKGHFWLWIWVPENGTLSVFKHLSNNFMCTGVCLCSILKAAGLPYEVSKYFHLPRQPEASQQMNTFTFMFPLATLFLEKLHLYLGVCMINHLFTHRNHALPRGESSRWSRGGGRHLLPDVRLSEAIAGALCRVWAVRPGLSQRR